MASQLQSCLPCGELLGAKRPTKQVSSGRVVTDQVAVHASALSKLGTGLFPTTPLGDSRRRKKVVYLVRHAEAEHNVLEKEAESQARNQGFSAEGIEKCRKAVLDNAELHNASLSPQGEDQVASSAGGFAEMISKTHYSMPSKVFVSPLYRTLQTATILFPEHEGMEALELLREKRTGHACDERGFVFDFKQDFPRIDFAAIEAQDLSSEDGYKFRSELKEDNAACGRRGQQLIEFLRQQEDSCIAVVTHKAVLREFCKDTLGPIMDEEGASMSATFGNAEVRVCEISWDLLDTPTVVARSMKEAAVRPPMTVKDVGKDSSFSSPKKGESAKFVDSVKSRPSVRKIAQTLGIGLDWSSGDDTMVTSRSLEAVGGELHVAVGSSDLQDSADAVTAAWAAMYQRLGGAPTFAMVCLDPSVEWAAVKATLRPVAGACWVVGGTSMCGVLANGVRGRIGITGFRNFAHQIGLAIVPNASGGAAKLRADTAEEVKKACRGSTPDLMFCWISPSLEDSVLEGIKIGCKANVPIIGGSCAANSVTTPTWWQFYGSMAGWGSISHGAIICCVSLFSDVTTSSLLSNCYAPTKMKAKITRAETRVIHEIDNKPAAEWMSEASGVLCKEGVDNMRELAHWPLAVPLKGQNRLIHVKGTPDGRSLECFNTVSRGDVYLMHTKDSDFIGAAATTVRTAVERSTFEVKCVLMIFCAGMYSAMPDEAWVESLPIDVPEVMVYFTFGEVGMFEGSAYFGNLMLNVVLFG